jgi:hypothetical protein
MRILRIVSVATLVLGSCGLLWAPFTQQTDCSHPGRTCLSDGGVVDLAGADLLGADLLGADFSGQPGDMACAAQTPPAWISDYPSLVPVTTPLAGVTGSGAGDLWVGGGTYLAYRSAAGTWTSTNYAAAAMGRAAFAPGTGKANFVCQQTNNGYSCEVDSALGVTQSLVSSKLLVGVWVSPPPGSQPYIIDTGGAVYYYNKPVWVLENAKLALTNMVAITGTVNGATTALWGVSATSNALTPDVSMNTWYSSAVTQTFNSLWAGPAPGSPLWLVGGGGLVDTLSTVAPAQQSLTALMSQPNPASAAGMDLYDVAGTADGAHLWAVGKNGTIVHYDIKCKTWNSENTGTTTLSAVWVDDRSVPKRVWAVGMGTVLRRDIP